MARWLIDGNNLLGARPDGWWRDRAGAMARLAAAVADWAGDDDEATIVFDGRPRPGIEAPAITIAWAPGGRNAADDAIVARLVADPDPAAVTVVTSDAALADRAVAAGAGAVVGAGRFRGWLDH